MGGAHTKLLRDALPAGRYYFISGQRLGMRTIVRPGYPLTGYLLRGNIYLFVGMFVDKNNNKRVDDVMHIFAYI